MSAAIVARLAGRAARAYIAGPELDDAFGICGMLLERGFGSSIGYWNGDESRAAVAEQYLQALATDALRHMNSYLSIKAPALGYDPDLLARVISAARRGKTPLHFDSLGPETVEPTLELLKHLSRDKGAALGYTLPGRWQRSLSDSAVAVDLGLRVRVVKGQWGADAEVDPVSGFLTVVDRLAGQARHVGVATHDARLARECLARLLHSGTPCELELLWGLPCAEPARVASDMGVPTRFYVPYGRAWLPYALAQAARRPRIFLWLVRDMLIRRRSAPKRLKTNAVPGKAPASGNGTRVPFY